MGNLQTKSSVLELLKKASRTSATPEEIELQRISFILANLSKNSTMTKADIEEILNSQRGCIAS